MRMPKDEGGNTIPALRLKPAGGHKIAVTSTSTRNSTAFAMPDDGPKIQNGMRVVSLYATVACFIRFGDSSVEVTADEPDHFYPSGVYYDYAVDGDDTHIAVIKAPGEEDGIIYCNEKY